MTLSNDLYDVELFVAHHLLELVGLEKYHYSMNNGLTPKTDIVFCIH